MKSRNKNVKIILFEEIEKKLFDNSLENLVLFGEENFISDKKRVYDFYKCPYRNQ